MNLISERNRYHKLTKKFPTNEFIKNKYIEFCSLTKSTNNRLRRSHNSTQLNKFISKPRQLWKCFNEIIRNKPYTPNEIKSILDNRGTVVHDPKLVANTINHYFCNIGRELYQKITPTAPTFAELIPFNPHTMALFPVSCAELCKVIANTKSNANLTNILPVNHLKQCLDFLASPLTDYINLCFETGSFPDMLKTARVVPIFKNGNSLSPSNYS